MQVFLFKFCSVLTRHSESFNGFLDKVILLGVVDTGYFFTKLSVAIFFKWPKGM